MTAVNIGFSISLSLNGNMSVILDQPCSHHDVGVSIVSCKTETEWRRLPGGGVAWQPPPQLRYIVRGV